MLPYGRLPSRPAGAQLSQTGIEIAALGDVVEFDAEFDAELFQGQGDGRAYADQDRAGAEQVRDGCDHGESAADEGVHAVQGGTSMTPPWAAVSTIRTDRSSWRESTVVSCRFAGTGTRRTDGRLSGRTRRSRRATAIARAPAPHMARYPHAPLTEVELVLS